MLPSSQVMGSPSGWTVYRQGAPPLFGVTTVGAHGQVTCKRLSGSDSVFTLALRGASSVWVTPRAGIVRAAVLTSVNDAVGER